MPDKGKAPFIKIVGDLHSPRDVKVINPTPDKLNKTHRVNQKEEASKGLVDKSMSEIWSCVFCHKPTHHLGLGDLFGPYFVSVQGAGTQEREVWFHEACLDKISKHLPPRVVSRKHFHPGQKGSEKLVLVNDKPTFRHP